MHSGTHSCPLLAWHPVSFRHPDGRRSTATIVSTKRHVPTSQATHAGSAERRAAEKFLLSQPSWRLAAAPAGRRGDTAAAFRALFTLPVTGRAALALASTLLADGGSGSGSPGAVFLQASSAAAPPELPPGTTAVPRPRCLHACLHAWTPCACMLFTHAGGTSHRHGKPPCMTRTQAMKPALVSNRCM